MHKDKYFDTLYSLCIHPATVHSCYNHRTHIVCSTVTALSDVSAELSVLVLLVLFVALTISLSTVDSPVDPLPIANKAKVERHTVSAYTLTPLFLIISFSF